MTYEGLSLILSRDICHHKDTKNDLRLSHNSTFLGVKLLDATCISLSVFLTEYTELGLYMNITAICHLCKVVDQCCKRYNKGLIEKDLFYQKTLGASKTSPLILPLPLSCFLICLLSI